MDDRVWQSYERSLRLRGASAVTTKNYRQTAAKVSAFTSAPLHHASRLDLEELFESWIGVYATTTRRHHWVNLSAFYRWCVEQEHLDKNPLKGIPVPTIEDEAPRVLSLKELKALVAACRGKSMRDRRDEAIIRLMSEPGGMRVSEVRLLRVADLDWSNLTASVLGKTNRVVPRVVPFSDRTAKSLEAYLKIRDRHEQAGSPYLWLTGRQSAHGMDATTLLDMVKRRAAIAGLGELDAKSIRHTSVDRALSAQISTPDMNKLFGWSDRSTMVNVYARGRQQARAIESARRSGLGDSL